MDMNDSQDTNFLSNVTAVDQEQFESDILSQVDKAYNKSINEEKETIKQNLNEYIDKIHNANIQLKELEKGYLQHLVSNKSNYAEFEKIKNLLNNKIGLKKLEISKYERHEKKLKERLKTIKMSDKVNDVLNLTGTTIEKDQNKHLKPIAIKEKINTHHSVVNDMKQNKNSRVSNTKSNKIQTDNFLFAHLKNENQKDKRKILDEKNDAKVPTKKCKEETIVLDSETDTGSTKRDAIIIESDKEGSVCSDASDRTMIYDPEEEEMDMYEPILKRKINVDNEMELDDTNESINIVKKKPKLEAPMRDDSQINEYYTRINDLNKEYEEELECISRENNYYMPKDTWDRLFEYQREGVRWLLELHLKGNGGILGDEMGLGKTIQVLSFLSGIYESRKKGFEVGPCIVVCPATVLRQWLDECRIWAPRHRVIVMHGSAAKQSSGSSNSSQSEDKRQRKLLMNLINKSESQEIPVVLLMSYAAISGQNELLDRLLTMHGNNGYLILDEGHKIKNPDAITTRLVKKLTSIHRIVLSGSPLQNCLRELWSLTDFVRPGLLGALSDFQTNLALPISRGGYQNATPLQVETAYRCACILRDVLSGTLLRRSKAQVRLQLPKKSEQVLFCGLTNHQVVVYREYLDSKECNAILSRQKTPFSGLTILRKICNHPDLVTGGPRAVINHPILGFGEEADIDNGNNLDLSSDACLKFGHYSRSGKMVVVRELLRSWYKPATLNNNNNEPSSSAADVPSSNSEHKVLLFCQGRQTLRLLKRLLKDEGYPHLCLHGGTPVGSRHDLVKQFNTLPSSSVFVFLLTTRVGGLGLNLTAADRVILYDPDWNPSTDIQARERAYRIGQRRPVRIYRLVCSGSIEERVYHRQVFKQLLCDRVLRNPRQRRFFKTQDLQELFRLDEKGTESDTSLMLAGSKHFKKLKRNNGSSNNLNNFFDSTKPSSNNSSFIEDDDDDDANNTSDLEQLDLPKQEIIQEQEQLNGNKNDTIKESFENEDIEKLRLKAKKISAALEKLKQQELTEQKSISVEGKRILNVFNREDYKKEATISTVSNTSSNCTSSGDVVIDTIVPTAAIVARSSDEHQNKLSMQDRLQIERVTQSAMKKLGTTINSNSTNSSISGTNYLREIVRHDKLLDDELVVKSVYIEPGLAHKQAINKAKLTIKWLKDLIYVGDQIQLNNQLFGIAKNQFLYDKNEENTFIQRISEKCWEEESRKFLYTNNDKTNPTNQNVRFSSRLLIGLIVNRKQQRQYRQNDNTDKNILDPFIDKDTKLMILKLFLFLLKTTIKLQKKISQTKKKSTQDLTSQVSKQCIKTNDILNRFKQEIKPDEKILFRELLSGLCEQVKSGKWVLRTEFHVANQISNTLQLLTNQILTNTNC